MATLCTIKKKCRVASIFSIKFKVYVGNYTIIFVSLKLESCCKGGTSVVYVLTQHHRLCTWCLEWSWHWLVKHIDVLVVVVVVVFFSFFPPTSSCERENSLFHTHTHTQTIIEEKEEELRSPEEAGVYRVYVRTISWAMPKGNAVRCKTTSPFAGD